jgi:hypothetical protein
VKTRHEAAGLALPVAPERIATAVIALVDGLSIQSLTEPEAVPDDLFGQVLALIEDGMAVRVKEPS